MRREDLSPDFSIPLRFTRNDIKNRLVILSVVDPPSRRNNEVERSESALSSQSCA